VKQKKNPPVPIHDAFGAWLPLVSGKYFFFPLVWKTDEKRNTASLEMQNL